MTIDRLLTYENSFVFLRNLHVTKNRLPFAGSQTLLASENEFNSTENLKSAEIVRDARRVTLIYAVALEVITLVQLFFHFHYCSLDKTFL